METDKYLGLFIDESKENLQKLNESLLKLEENSEDLEILNDIFRVAHTLKGMSRTMGFNDIADLTHNMENVLDPMRSGTLKASGSIIDILFKCLDKLENLVDKVVDGKYEDKSNNIEELISNLQKTLEGSSKEDEKKPKQEEITFNEYEIALIDNAKEKDFRAVMMTVSLTNDCVLPAVRAYMVVKAIESQGEIIKTCPPAEELENGNFEKTFKLFLVTKETNENLIEVASEISEIDKVLANDLDLGNLKRESQNIETTQEASEEQTGSASSAANQQTATKIVSQTLRVSAERLDKLMNLVGELVINRTRISELSNDLRSNDLSASVGLLGNITTDLQEIVMKLRMVPIEQVFNRFPRLVRDYSKDQNKDINLIITGKDTEIDRVVIDEIGDPLVHLIRNSLDHGLETPEERINAGKSAKGTLELSAFNEGDNILIKVSDDGRGINPEKVKATAIKKGVITQEVAKSMSEKEAIELIFAPGFSTVEVATDISGRGVGMDVVKSKVATLGGNVSIASKVREGTTITISLPSTMAIVQALLTKVGEEIYAAPLNYISEVIDIYPSQIKNVQNKEVIVLREHTLPLVRLHKILEVPNYVEEPDKPLTVVIIKTQNKYLGVIVSELIGQQEVVIKPINKKLCSENYISGATTLGNGQVALILNINGLS